MIIRHQTCYHVEIKTCSELDAHIVEYYWRMACMLPVTWNIDFALVDDREKNIMPKESYDYKVGAMVSKLQLGDDEL